MPEKSDGFSCRACQISRKAREVGNRVEEAAGKGPVPERGPGGHPVIDYAAARAPGQRSVRSRMASFVVWWLFSGLNLFARPRSRPEATPLHSIPFKQRRFDRLPQACLPFC
ncbi:unnamed protein product, partial [Mesorhabditis belari]|uniref:Uncharacterized protein n=1 Tax=Mesorhabditis belari TaxID=2138241 RepID=A0AAF3EXI0_9BILA